MFPCTNCGLCCQNISTVKELKDFNLGNGICKHFNMQTFNCNIYDYRPDICNIDKMYDLKYNSYLTKNDFYIENAKVCNQLQEKYKLDTSFKIILKD